MTKTVSRRLLFYSLVILAIPFFIQCAPVKGYQKVYLNDEEMMLSNRKVELFDSNFQSYREGAVGGTNGNSGSGCGCN